jgi:hypothetical protein
MATGTGESGLELGYPTTNAEEIEAKFATVVQAIATISAD